MLVGSASHQFSHFSRGNSEFVTEPSPPQRWLCQSTSEHWVSPVCATQATGPLTLALAGLSPAERASFNLDAPVREQSGRAFTSTDPSSRAGCAPFQITCAGAAVSQCACRYVHYLQPRSLSHGRSLLSGIAPARLCILDTGGSRMRRHSGQDPLGSKR